MSRKLPKFSLIKSVICFLIIIIAHISYSQKPDDFKTGYYFDSQGNKIEGLIFYAYNYRKQFKFKSDQEDRSTNIGYLDCPAFVVELDTFAVIKNFQFEGAAGGLSAGVTDFVQVIETGKINLYKHYSTQGGGNPLDYSQTIALTNYIISGKGSTYYITMRKRNKKKFKKQIPGLFPDNEIIEKVNNGTFSWDSMPEIVQIYNSRNP